MDKVSSYCTAYLHPVVAYVIICQIDDFLIRYHIFVFQF